MAQPFQDSKCYAIYMVIFTIDNTGTAVFDFPFAQRLDFRAFVYTILPRLKETQIVKNEKLPRQFIYLENTFYLLKEKI